MKSGRDFVDNLTCSLYKSHLLFVAEFIYAFANRTFVYGTIFSVSVLFNYIAIAFLYIISVQTT